MIVHEYRNGYPIRQDKFYSNRTDLERHRATMGDFSLTLKDPCFRDIGTYICTVYKNREIHTQKVVRLKFKDRTSFTATARNLAQHQLGIGDFSLTLRNPCFRDSGTYICTIHKNRNIYTQKVVQLEFKEGWWSWILRRAFRR
ncbi:hypothetical protein PFLUV_G00237770 [Perca fluviatilis]|uniref:Immunoglobulin V-set domain-containing protein n=1 Tax=Perca fluviatilis TaxID=8168 RepID=A0A6A5EGV2_PERFL|nr:hypothetical protein PFLUV_G00237770 [Perca fluviatilis]